MTVKSTGAVAIVGVLADGTAYTAGAFLSEAASGVQSAGVPPELVPERRRYCG